MAVGAGWAQTVKFTVTGVPSQAQTELLWGVSILGETEAWVGPDQTHQPLALPPWA